jgi:VCBS repeat protein/type IX secretion system substrate protein/PKD domain-containing protein
MKKIFSIFFLSTIIPFFITAQTFTEIDAGFMGFGYGHSTWGDFDNDDDLDVLLTGQSPTFIMTKLYRNNDGDSFEEVNTNFDNVYNGIQEWGDYNNDGFLDILLTGATGMGSITRIYKNNGDTTFTELDEDMFEGSSNGISRWIDYDNDGDLDVFLSNILFTKLYRNNGDDLFVEQNTSFKTQYNGDAEWGDINNDGFLDLIITGTTSYNPYNLNTTFYINNGDNTFSEQELANIPKLKEGKIDLVDFDNDSDLDVFIIGNSSLDYPYNPVSKLFKNNNDGTFSEVLIFSIPYLFNVGGHGYEGKTKWVDIDNNGMADLFIWGNNQAPKFFKNSGSGEFVEYTDFIFPEFNFSSINAADYDNDGDADIIISGRDIDEIEMTKFYKNEITDINLKPNKIIGTNTVVEGNKATLNWNFASDDLTPTLSLCYSIYIEKSMVSSTVKSSMSNLSTGYRRIAKLENIIDTFYTIHQLDTGLYNWGVQSIDHSFLGSSFSDISYFEITFTSSVSPTDDQVILPLNNGDTLFVYETEEPDSRQWKYSTQPGGPYNFDIIAATDTFCVPNFVDFGSYYIICESTKDGVTLTSNETKISIPILNENKNISLPKLSDGESVWADIDNDDDLDIIITGSYTTEIFRNDSTSFTDLNADLKGLAQSSVDCSDYNNDGFIDILLCGIEYSNRYTKIYKNNGDGSFSEQVHILLEGISEGKCMWGDFDNDGNTDIIYSGLNSGEEIKTYMYKNNGNNSFTSIENNLKGCSMGDFDLGDYNLDGFIDIIITGIDINGNRHTTLYKNEDEFYFIQTLTFDKVDQSTVEFGDYDNDGDLDYFITGSATSFTPKIYRNDRNDSFVDIEVPIDKSRQGDAKWFDYDTDGDLDILYNGAWGNEPRTTLLNNMGEDTFVEEKNVFLPDLWSNSISFADYDNDNDLDLFLQESSSYRLFQNNSIVKNTKPSTPNDLQDTVIGNTVILKWNKPSDNETATPALTYNLRIGTTPGGIDVIAPITNITNGYNKTIGYGNIGYDTSFVIYNVVLDTLYWSVQCIDNSYKASEFSTEQKVGILPPFVGYSIGSIIDINSNGCVRFADYDNDNDLDVIVAGMLHDDDGYNYATKLFRNEGDFNFIENTAANFDWFFECSIEWCDYNLDNHIDVLITGRESSHTTDKSLKLYRNNGDGTFTIQLQFEPIGWYHTYVDWGDFNNDGLPDFLLSDNYVKIYENKGNGSFLYRHDLYYAYATQRINSTWGDFNNDGYLDLLSKKYGLQLNISDIGNDFTYLKTLGVINGIVNLGDYNNDNYIDIIHTGTDLEGEYNSNIFKNSDGTEFEKLNSNFRAAESADIKWGDLNLDGRSDFVLSGSSSTKITKLYLNEGNDIFTSYDSKITDIGYSSIDFGDINNDGGLDVAIIGLGGSGIWENKYFIGNTIPKTPISLQSEVYNYGIKLSWGRATDLESTEGGLSYNIMVRKDSLWGDIVNPLADISGFRKLSKIGNAQYRDFFLLDSLPIGTYYWRVQAIDHSFAGGEWAEEHSFTITRLRPDFISDTVCIGDSTQFTDLSLFTGTEIAEWHWDFGDDSDSTFKEATPDNKYYHTYGNSGKYYVTLTLTDTAGVTKSKLDSVLVLQKPKVTFSADNKCYGTPIAFTNTTNENELTISSWNWKLDDVSFSTSKTPEEQNKGIGSYEIELIVIANNGCSDSISSKVAVGEIPSDNIVNDGDWSVCQGDTVELSVIHNPNYSYKWLINSENIGVVDTNIYNPVTGGIYSVRIENLIGNCVDTTDQRTLTISPKPDKPYIQVERDTIFCKGDSVVLSSNYVENQIYKWKLWDDVAYSGSNEYAVKNESGKYSLEVFNTYNCSSHSDDSIHISIHEIPLVPTVTPDGPTTFCSGNQVILSVSNNQDVSYQWKNDEITITDSVSNQITIKETGNYYLEIINAIDCSVQTEIIPVTVHSVPNIPIISTSDITVFCSGDSAELSTNYSAGLIYSWKLNGEGNLGELNNYYAKESGLYSLKVTNQNECFAISDEIEITKHDLPTIPTIIADGPTSFCTGNSVVLSVTNNSDVSYQWKNQNGVITDSISNKITINEAGEYFLEIKNANDCSVQTESVSVTVLSSPTQPIIVANGETTFCNGSSVDLSTDLVEGISYQWLYNNAVVGANSNTYSASLAGTYSLVVTNTNECSATSANPIVVSHYESPASPVIQVDGNTAFCSGDSVLLSFSEIENCTSKWLRYDVPIASNATSYYAKLEGDYSVELTNEFGCSSNSSNTIEVITLDAPDPVSINYESSSICSGESILLSVTSQDECSYQWYDSGNEIEGEITNECDVNTTGLYHLVINNQNNCSYISNAVDILVSDIPEMQSIIVSGDTNICPGEIIQMQVADSINYSYQWKLDGINISDATTNQTLASDEGIYTVLIANTENENCAITTPTKEIIIKPALQKPDLFAQGPDMWILACSNDSAQNYRWYYNGENITDANDFIYMANQQLGEYFVSINDGGECYVPSDIITIPLSATDMKALDIFGHIKIYPNPTPGTFTIEMDNEIIGTLYIRINNANARELFNIKHNKTTRHFQTQMDLSGQGKGMYFIEFRFEDDKTVRKLIVE